MTMNGMALVVIETTLNAQWYTVTLCMYCFVLYDRNLLINSCKLILLLLLMVMVMVMMMMWCCS
jgi:hypothetical protein